MWKDEGQGMGGGHQYPPSNGYSAAPPQMHSQYNMSRGGMGNGGVPAPLMTSNQSVQASSHNQFGGYWGDPSQMAPPSLPSQMTMQPQQRPQSGYGSANRSYGGNGSGWEQQQMPQQQSQQYQQQQHQYQQQMQQWQTQQQPAPQWNTSNMGMMGTPPQSVMNGGSNGRQMGGGNGGGGQYWQEQQHGYNMTGEHQHSQPNLHQPPPAHSHHNSYGGQMNGGGGGGGSRNNQWSNDQHQGWNNGGGGGGNPNFGGQWDARGNGGSNGGSEWGGADRSSGRRMGGGDQWMSGGGGGGSLSGRGGHDDRMLNQFDQMSAVGSWNPNEAPEELPGNDMVWRDPNPKQKKPPARDIGTSIWGDPSHQRSPQLWTQPEDAPSDFNWMEALGAPSHAFASSGLTWDDPIPSDRAARTSDLHKNITSADSAADLAHVSHQLEAAVNKGILPVTVLTRVLHPEALAELNELLHCMTRIEHLQVERARTAGSQAQGGISKASMLSSIDLSIHQSKLDMERIRSNICREDPEETATSRLNQWRKNESSIDQLLQATSKITLHDNRGVSDWLEASPAPHESAEVDDSGDDPKEFIPGRKWTWNDPNMIAQDPNITPGQVKQSPLVAVKSGDDVTIARPIAPIDPKPHGAGIWMVFHHNSQSQHIYPLCKDLGKIVHFKIIDHQIYVKFAAEVDPKHASSMIIREFPSVATSMRFISDPEMSSETTGNDVLQS